MRHNVGCHAAFHVDRLKLFGEAHAVDLDGARFVARHASDQRTETVDGVTTGEGTRRVRSSTGEDDLYAKCPLASRLDATTRRFSENRHVTPDELRAISSRA